MQTWKRHQTAVQPECSTLPGRAAECPGLHPDARVDERGVMMSVSRTPQPLFSVFTVRRILVAATAIGVAAIIYHAAGDSDDDLKLRIQSHGIPSWDTFYDAVLRNKVELNGPPMYSPRLLAYREVFLVNDANDHLFSLLFFGAPRKLLDWNNVPGELVGSFQTVFDEGIANPPLHYKIFMAREILKGSGEAGVPKTGEKMIQPVAWPTDIPSIDGFTDKLDCKFADTGAYKSCSSTYSS